MSAKFYGICNGRVFVRIIAAELYNLIKISAFSCLHFFLFKLVLLFLLSRLHRLSYATNDKAYIEACDNCFWKFSCLFLKISSGTSKAIAFLCFYNGLERAYRNTRYNHRPTYAN